MNCEFKTGFAVDGDQTAEIAGQTKNSERVKVKKCDHHIFCVASSSTAYGLVLQIFVIFICCSGNLN